MLATFSFFLALPAMSADGLLVLFFSNFESLTRLTKTFCVFCLFVGWLVGWLLACLLAIMTLYASCLSCYIGLYPLSSPPANELILNAHARHVNKLPFGHSTVIDIQSHCSSNCMKYRVETNKMVGCGLIYLRTRISGGSPL